MSLIDVMHVAPGWSVGQKPEFTSKGLTDKPLTDQKVLLPAGRQPAAAVRWLEFAQWSCEPLGALLTGEERRLLAGVAPSLFGYHLLQLGLLGDDVAYLENCPIHARTLAMPAPAGAVGVPFLRAEPERLPVGADTMDAVLLPHTLDLADDPHQVLREAERVLVPEGRLVVVGFNPWSLWGVRRLLGGRARAPWYGHFIGYPRLHDWLSLLGFGIDRVEVLMFRPPVGSAALQARLAFLDRVGERLLPMVAGVYVVLAVKRVSTLTPVKLPWQRRPAIRRRLVEPSTRGMRRV
jgi:SAM-dependent methyltransferase